MLLFSIKLVKSPILPNGELRKKQAARIWLLVLSILSGSMIITILIIISLCLKDFQDVSAQKTMPASVNGNNAIQNEFNSTEFEFIKDIQEIKKLRRLGIIDDAAFKKAVIKLVERIINE